MRKIVGTRLVGIISMALLIGAPSAPANVVDEVVGTVTSLPSPPVAVPEIRRAPSPTPPVRIEVPGAPAGPPVKEPPAPSASEDVPSPDLQAVGSSPSHAVDNLAGSERDASGALAGTRNAGREDNPLGAGEGSGSEAGSGTAVEPGREAPLRRWLAHVWPAVALGPFGELLTALPGSVEAVTGASALELRQVLLALQTGAGVGTGEEIGNPASAAAPQSSPQPSPPPVSIPIGGAISAFILIVASACLLALLLLAVRQELGATDQWWPH